ncbi:MAG: tyrosine--tRNA ligase [Erysipelotrichaceae bacterium]|nr:tyrosine--tRNA ligase [Erysipelotrichaceae bacterium]
MTFLEELEYRGLIKDVTDREGLEERVKTPMTVYCGFDPTADSLHVGHLQQILLLMRWQKEGHRPIALCGGATGMIGDPRPTTERRLLTLEDVQHNVECIKAQLGRFLNFNEEGGAILANNYDWLGHMNILEFLRDYGKNFNVNYMLNKDTIASRLEKGISFTEFTYTILQAADWLHLYQTYNCIGQIGGSDQWGNLTSGTELIRKIEGADVKVFGITSPLITKSDGTKFGKSEGANVWLDPERTSPYQFYQFFINSSDDDVINFLKRLTFLSPEEISALEVSLKEEPHKREAQKALARETTRLVHGEEGLQEALMISETFFSGDFSKLNVNQLKQALSGVTSITVEDGASLLETLVEGKICSSKREAREMISGNSITVNGTKVNALDAVLNKSEAYGEEITVIRKGKKSYFLVNFK